VTDFQECRTNQ